MKPGCPRVRVTRTQWTGTFLVNDQRPITARTARTREDYLAAFRLLYDRYISTGLTTESPRQLRVAPAQLAPGSQLFVAERNSQVIGTVTLATRLNQLPAFSSHPELKDPMRFLSNRVGEIMSLAIAPPETAEPTTAPPADIFWRMTRLLIHFARARSLDHLIAVVHPRHAKFYHRILGFEIIGQERPCPTVDCRPGIPLMVNLQQSAGLRPRHREIYFEDTFTPDELRPYHLSESDRNSLLSIANVSIEEAA
jgi:hypothetical protein